MRKKLWKLISIWVILFVVGLSLISLYRQHAFQEKLEETISELTQPLEEAEGNLEEEWENIDENDPARILAYLQSEMMYDSLLYSLDFSEYIKEQEKGNILTGTLVTHACEGLLSDRSEP